MIESVNDEGLGWTNSYDKWMTREKNQFEYQIARNRKLMTIRHAGWRESDPEIESKHDKWSFVQQLFTSHKGQANLALLNRVVNEGRHLCQPILKRNLFTRYFLFHFSCRVFPTHQVIVEIIVYLIFL